MAPLAPCLGHAGLPCGSVVIRSASSARTCLGLPVSGGGRLPWSSAVTCAERDLCSLRERALWNREAGQRESTLAAGLSAGLWRAPQDAGSQGQVRTPSSLLHSWCLRVCEGEELGSVRRSWGRVLHSCHLCRLFCQLHITTVLKMAAAPSPADLRPRILVPADCSHPHLPASTSANPEQKVIHCLGSDQ